MNDFVRRLTPLGQRGYLVYGILLFALKTAVDTAVSRYFGHPFTPLFYFSPLDSPTMDADRVDGTYWMLMWAAALPFMASGVWLTLRRLLDTRLPNWMVAFFFVPFANLLFFAALLAIGSQEAPRAQDTPYRAAPPEAPAPRSVNVAVAMGAVAGSVVSLGMVGLSVGLLREYGAALFVGAPTVGAFVATWVCCSLNRPAPAPSFFAAMMSLSISMLVLIAFAIEGAVCIVMVAPLAGGAGMLGWALGFAVASYAAESSKRVGPAALSVLPIWLVLEFLAPGDRVDDHVVSSELDIDAPPEVVWNRVLAFETLPEPEELVFRAGVAAPTGAVIRGSGVGAVRRCQFTTGEFVEPITVWNPGHELSFDVAEQPDPMRELTLYDGPRPPHLDGYFATTHGQFELDALPNGGTRLTGRTWYELNVFPRPYWAMWSDMLVHTIHLRVMRQIKRLAESDALR